MSKYLYVIMHLPIQRYLKWWADRFAYLKELFFVRICETNPAYLTDCLKGSFLKFIIKGKTEQGENPSPDNPQEIVNVEGTIAIKKSNKNLFDENYEDISGSLIYRPIYVGTGKFTMSSDIPFSSDGASLFLLAGSVSSGASTSINGVYANHSITQDSINGFVTVAYRISWFNPVNYHTQLEKGSIATDYIEHQGKTYNFPLSQGQKLMEDGTIENKIINFQRLINLGDLEWYIRTDYSGDSNYALFRQGGYIKGDYKSINYCSHFPIVSSNPSPAYNCIRLTDTTNYGINILIQKSIASTGSELKTWLQNNNVQAQITPKEPDEIEFTQEQKAVYDEIINDGTYKGITNISVTANINPDLYIEYKSSKEEE